MPVVRSKFLSQHIVADPKSCHGKLTFAGTRVLVSDVFEMVAVGMSWKEIVRECHDGIGEEMIAEAIRLAGRVYHDKTDQLTN